jgi:hypothetical protein
LLDSLRAVRARLAAMSNDEPQDRTEAAEA